MEQCEFLDICSLAKSGDNVGFKDEYCDKAPLRCARFMVYQGASEGSVPDDLMPNDKVAAYAILAEA